MNATRPWVSLWATVLVAGLLAACGGGDGASIAETSQPTQLQLGERFSMESALISGGSETSYYKVYGVTTEGELVDSNHSNLVDGVRIPLLESVTRNDVNSAISTGPQYKHSTFIDPSTLIRKQQAFYQQLWDGVANNEGTRDPLAIQAEIDDLDGRVVDLMDDSAASGVPLSEYLSFYDLLDVMPAFKDKQFAELELRTALASDNQFSVFDESPPDCPAGHTRTPSSSGLSFICLPALPNAQLANDENSLRAQIDAFGQNPTQTELLAMQVRLQQWTMLAQIQSTINKELLEAMKRIVQKGY